MKLATSQAASILLSILTSRATANHCVFKENSWGNEIDLWAENVYDISGICGGLWDNLHHWSACTASLTYCGGIEDTHILNWKFNVPVGCNGGMINWAWYEATTNRFGSVNCQGG